ncbi:hypothetical protein ASPACDRAFT_43580 [Aspergillus aculeatus ATCC 16872]|uniref:F-box domain-containing protein n=1 Tax=Aspergillus aculeatus (strain ATCC 16872 / CBS 172.66 / WB 5094) TaxID=690307 RepID=A0A1L9WV22_ASPA1|nr:uncharacterized protein ASPACDRAFT_43580 [Aspergillus aculeatus ATCC 16872]OJJ99942.1 hypothetical protein ASPACDRAFT_43580 [Aspergillus aculeatus ATCC 16872]
MSHFLEHLRQVVRQARRHPSSQRPRKSPITSKPARNTRTAWEKLPVDVLVKILVQCELEEIHSFSATCRLLHQRVYHNEAAIAKAYLQHRRREDPYHLQRCQEPNIAIGDDLTFVSDLFPPPPPHYTPSGTLEESPDYSFGYLTDLTRCWRTCVRLSFYLAEYLVQHYLETDPTARELWASSKTEKEFVYSKGVGALQARLLPSITYLVYFLESCADTTTPTHSLDCQERILQEPPFTDPDVLLSTHHTMHTLIHTVRHLMAPDIPYTSSQTWVSLLLTTSTLERIVDLFVAVAADSNQQQPDPRKKKEKHDHQRQHHHSHSPNNNHNDHPPIQTQSHPHTHTPHRSETDTHWSHRMDFLWHMRRDYGDYLAALVGDDQTDAPDTGHSGMVPRLQEIWFAAAERAIRERGLAAHAPEVVRVLHGGGPRLGCAVCL